MLVGDRILSSLEVGRKTGYRQLCRAVSAGSSRGETGAIALIPVASFVPELDWGFALGDL
jgi:hypothetical protein